MAPTQPLGPERVSYSFSQVLDLGKRLRRRPRIESPAVSSDTATVGGVRSFRRTPLTLIQLDVLLRNAYLTPFTLREFEDYLTYKERDVENLYATLFMRAYTTAHAKRGTGQHTEASLAESLRSAIDHFFVADAPLEVNLPDAVRTALIIDAGHCIDPSILTAAKHACEDALRESLHNFVRLNLGNSQRQRGFLGMSLGAFTLLLGVVLTLLCALAGVSRAWRTFALPLYWAGALLGVTSYGQTCIIIYFFGDLRQLHRWELARPVPSSTDLAKVDSAASTSSDDLGKSPADSTAALFSADPFLGASTTRPPSYTSTWDGAKMFSPVTRVEDPVVIAEQRRRVINGATYGLVVMATLAIPTFAVPNRG